MLTLKNLSELKITLAAKKKKKKYCKEESSDFYIQLLQYTV